MPQMGPLPWVIILAVVLLVLSVSTSILYYEVSLKSLGSKRSSSSKAEWIW